MELTKEEKSVISEVLYYTRSNMYALDSVAENLDLNEEYLTKIIDKGVEFFAVGDNNESNG